MITLQGAIEKSPILLSQYWKSEWLDGNIIISYFGGSNNIFADCIYLLNANGFVISSWVCSSLLTTPLSASQTSLLKYKRVYYKVTILFTRKSLLAETP